MIRKRLVTLGVPALAVLFALLLVSAQLAEAQTETVLYSFGSKVGDGANPFFVNLIDKSGNLYGTTYGGGAYGYGTAFEITKAGAEKVLYSFGGQAGDGLNPLAGLTIGKKGSFYGATQHGGAYGGGTVYELPKKDAEKPLYSFGSQAGDGYGPVGALAFDKAGNLYGTTNAGGANGYGTVFEFAATSTEKVLYSFGPPPDGNTLYAGVTLDKKGNLYSATTYGGGNCGGGVANCGTVFEVTAAGVETQLYDFGSQAGDGYVPQAGVIFDKKGNLYGTTTYGGTYNEGTVFEITKAGVEKVVYNFGSQPGDGSQPHQVTLDKAGNLYGTTYVGGTYNEGTIFELLTTSGTEKVLYSFGSQAGDGQNPEGGVTIDKKGDLYGTTTYGGTYGYGTVFKLTP